MELVNGGCSPPLAARYTGDQATVSCSQETPKKASAKKQEEEDEVGVLGVWLELLALVAQLSTGPAQGSSLLCSQETPKKATPKKQEEDEDEVGCWGSGLKQIGSTSALSYAVYCAHRTW